ncbi:MULTISPECIES: ribosome hibernation-promoting factor, HPF/YfiA family [Paenibacillus]|jgi:putative sigma-54 modulation protein|uniref:Ribosome hibernation promoting factor n=2 Tax=Paenibacillus barengoltzii TaxID=343517 RepID=R9L5Z4_9BACL|nr:MULTISPECIES: ribosome-associated translation inhibitor RaiA [Paenibacillus]PZN25833.1 MAG: ribosome-associated translation inhibitor RaiA [Pseudomonadota bacterium]EOS54105.1 ribosomal subunit interface protein [Paenibacillus barengoltzii G22]MCT2195934.1 ribosome-associated translation inhibitor RaiA [Paenibacillus sp. p3-SID1389]MDU0331700.1 ribosome-associated translation inhibitor RaiA [Paenibacillus sp. 3LSP]MEC2346318.1 ribosome-associated translation inhibitor RaiA [Paenibacillus ba
MNFSIRGQQIEVTEALRDYVDKKLSRLDKYFDAPPTSDGTVTLSVVRGLHAVEVTIPLTGVVLRAEDRSDDMYASIDAVVDKLERQIRKHKTKINRKLRQKGVKNSLFVEGTTAGSVALDEGEEELEVVRTKRFTLKPMDVEEAILQMNMVGHNFFVFSNIDTKEVNVVYKRNDGKYGLIEQD